MMMCKRKPLTEEHKRKISEALKGKNKGKIFSEEHKLHLSQAQQGKCRSSEQRKKVSEKLKGRISPMLGRKHSKETRSRISFMFKGKTFSEDTRRKISESKKGEKSYCWEGGKTKENILIRGGVEYRLWREAVFARDNWTCQECGTRGGVLHSHHIKSFANYPELRFAIDNGITLCKACHKKTGNFGKRNQEYVDKVNQFIREG